MKIIVKNLKHEDKTASGSGKSYINQIMTIELNDEIRNLKVYRPHQADMYPVGEYKIASDSFRVNNYGQLEIGFLNLILAK